MWAFLLAPTHLIKHTRGITSREHLFYHRSLPGPLITHLLEHHTMAPLSFAQQLPRLTPPPHDDLFIPPLPLFEPGGSRSDRSFGLFIRPLRSVSSERSRTWNRLQSPRMRSMQQVVPYILHPQEEIMDSICPSDLALDPGPATIAPRSRSGGSRSQYTSRSHSHLASPSP